MKYKKSNKVNFEQSNLENVSGGFGFDDLLNNVSKAVDVAKKAAPIVKTGSKYVKDGSGYIKGITESSSSKHLQRVSKLAGGLEKGSGIIRQGSKLIGTAVGVDSGDDD